MINARSFFISIYRTCHWQLLPNAWRYRVHSLKLQSVTHPDSYNFCHSPHYTKIVDFPYPGTAFKKSYLYTGLSLLTDDCLPGTFCYVSSGSFSSPYSILLCYRRLHTFQSSPAFLSLIGIKA